MKKLLLAFGFLTLTILAAQAANANELLLRCNWGLVSNGVRIELDISTVTEVYEYFLPPERHYHATITSEFVEWRTGPNVLRRVYRTDGFATDYYLDDSRP